MSELALDPATKPLKHPKYEIFARQRALNQSPLIAGQIAGLNYDRRNLFRIEKKSAVAARIAWLSRQDEEALREKRNRLEELLWVGLYVDRADFYEIVETPITDRNGHVAAWPVGAAAGSHLSHRAEASVDDWGCYRDLSCHIELFSIVA